MGRDSRDSTMVGTSIALLQERFRQLQKDKQRREKKKKKLLNLLSDATAVHLECENLSIVGDKDSLSLGLDFLNVGKRDDHAREARLMPDLTELWPSNATKASSSRSFESPDVDTTLHL